MQFKQKLTKIGNSLGIILPKQLIDSLKLKVGVELKISEVQDKIIISKDTYATASPEVLRIAEEVATEYGDVFEKLANK